MDEKKIESEANELSEEVLEQIAGGEETPVLQIHKDFNANRANVG